MFKHAIISIMAALAKQELVKISESTIAGLACAQGKQLGRPRRCSDRKKLVQMRRRGDSLGTIAKQFGISRTTVCCFPLGKALLKMAEGPSAEIISSRAARRQSRR